MVPVQTHSLFLNSLFSPFTHIHISFIYIMHIYEAVLYSTLRLTLWDEHWGLWRVPCHVLRCLWKQHFSFFCTLFKPNKKDIISSQNASGVHHDAVRIPRPNPRIWSSEWLKQGTSVDCNFMFYRFFNLGNSPQRLRQFQDVSSSITVERSDGLNLYGGHCCLMWLKKSLNFKLFSLHNIAHVRL